MKREEAEAVLNYLAAGMGENLAPNQAAVWLPEIERLDADEAMRVAMDMVRTYPRMPSLADFRRAVIGQVAVRQQEEQRDGGTGRKPPEWVFVWAWCRYTRDPREQRPFPQQRPHIDETLMLSTTEYEKLRREWTEAGSPTDLSVLPVPIGKR